ncbi:hypothetical protein IVA98_26035 [Bradyrhizobium sp. 160]|uniref:hypothetical protein n=1 Tax=Bradyrhizobium sp. 160 TaxID=2782634 RepID=UPI001FFA7F35|nr:hypothetical protein [Bradyrhizobium sp. 160]MCK1626557.1 hypothetical protein [Bradyrhizobium sp. 160]
MKIVINHDIDLRAAITTRGDDHASADRKALRQNASENALNDLLGDATTFSHVWHERSELLPRLIGYQLEHTQIREVLIYPARGS